MRRPKRFGWAGLAVAVTLGLSACGGSNAKPTASTPTATAPHVVSTGTAPATTPTSPTTTGTLTGGPVPAGTEATSVTFISPTTAFVLGTAPCDVQPCSAILETSDRGSHWVGLAAPRENVSYYLGDGLWGLRFADANSGFAFGQGLWETSDGGNSWQKVTAPAPTVLSLEAVQAREIVALAQSCHPGEGCTGSVGLYHEPLGGSWTKVAAVGRSTAPGGIAVHGASVWVAAGRQVYYSTDGGASFNSEPIPRICSRVQTNSITDDGTHVYLLCTGSGFTGQTIKYLYATNGPGAPWTLVGKPPTLGGGGQISAGSDSSIVITSYSAASWLYRSSDGGHTWKTVLTEDDGGAGWNDLGFTTPTDAVVIHGPAIAGSRRPGKVLLSSDGGLTWHAASF